MLCFTMGQHMHSLVTTCGLQTIQSYRNQQNMIQSLVALDYVHRNFHLRTYSWCPHMSRPSAWFLVHKSRNTEAEKLTSVDSDGIGKKEELLCCGGGQVDLRRRRANARNISQMLFNTLTPITAITGQEETTNMYHLWRHHFSRLRMSLIFH